MENRYDKFTSLILNINRSIQKIKAMEMLAFGLKGKEVQCVYHLSLSENGLTLSELCALCFEDKGALSRTLVDLENKGIVKKGEGALKYKCPYLLTEKGRTLGEKINGLTQEMVNRGSSGIKDSERERLYKNLTLINENLKNICKLYGGKNGKNID